MRRSKAQFSPSETRENLSSHSFLFIMMLFLFPKQLQHQQSQTVIVERNRDGTEWLSSIRAESRQSVPPVSREFTVATIHSLETLVLNQFERTNSEIHKGIAMKEIWGKRERVAIVIVTPHLSIPCEYSSRRLIQLLILLVEEKLFTYVYSALFKHGTRRFIRLTTCRCKHYTKEEREE